MLTVTSSAKTNHSWFFFLTVAPTSLGIPYRASPQPASPKADLISQLTTTSPTPEPSAISSLPSTSRDEPAHSNLAQETRESSDKQVKLDLIDDIDGSETPERAPVTPKRRQPAEEKKKSLIPDLEEDSQDAVEEATPGGEPKLSERVIKEREEREKRAAQKKEEQEREAAAKQAEADRLKQEADDKKQAAEERLKQRAEEAARRKEEQLKKQEVSLSNLVKKEKRVACNVNRIACNI